MRDTMYKKTKYFVEENLITLRTEPPMHDAQVLSTSQGAAMSCARGRPGAT